MRHRRYRPVSDVLRVAGHALRSGGVLRAPTSVEWDVSGNCENPRWVLLWGRPEQRPKKLTFTTWDEWTAALQRAALNEGSASVELWTRCRRCGPCMRLRSAAWSHRAAAETVCSRRTWFGTLTMGPEAHFAMELRARRRLLAGGTAWSRLSDHERFKEHASEGARELTLWLKRVRKESEAPLRYMLVTEAHKTGLPHWHCLLHEQEVPVTWDTLSGQWPHGHTMFKLVPLEQSKEAARYVSKYLSKSALTRVRASLAYGSPPSVSSERM